MLTLELNGKSVSTADDKQTIHINGNPIEVERVGDAIYVNKIAINLVVVDKKAGFVKKAATFVVGASAVAAFAFTAANYEVVFAAFNTAVQTVEPYTSGAFDWVQGLVSGNETAPAAPEAATPVE